MNKIEMIQRSMRCFAFGLAGLVPILGIPFAIVSLVNYGKVKRGQGGQWNPAQRYLFWGALCARANLWLFFVIPGSLLLMAKLIFNL